jgi:hypothetical protein
MDSRSPYPEWAHQAWLAVLVLAVSALSFVFACATPFAAFGVLAALTLSRTDAIRITIALWMANQAIGFGILGYPVTVNSVAWGLAIGGAAVSSTMVARLIISRLRTARGLTRAVVALAGTFAVYEIALFTVAVAGLGGIGSFAALIVGRIVVINAAALVGLHALYRIGVAVGVSRRPAVATPAVARSVPERPWPVSRMR